MTAALFWSAGTGLTGAAAATYTPLPAHVYAPCYETYLAPEHAEHRHHRSAVRGQVLHAGLPPVHRKNSCSLNWNGNSAQPLSYYASDIAALRAAGGDVIPSFGGYSADQGGTEIADSCTSVSQIAADYEQVITTLGVTRLDMDVEAKSLNNTAGIARRNQAIALTAAVGSGERHPRCRSCTRSQWSSTAWTPTARPCCTAR